MIDGGIREEEDSISYSSSSSSFCCHLNLHESDHQLPRSDPVRLHWQQPAVFRLIILRFDSILCYSLLFLWRWHKQRSASDEWTNFVLSLFIQFSSPSSSSSSFFVTYSGRRVSRIGKRIGSDCNCNCNITAVLLLLFAPTGSHSLILLLVKKNDVTGSKVSYYCLKWLHIQRFSPSSSSLTPTTTTTTTTDSNRQQVRVKVVVCHHSSSIQQLIDCDMTRFESEPGSQVTWGDLERGTNHQLTCSCWEEEEEEAVQHCIA